MKKTATETYPTEDSTRISLVVRKMDGTPCYTVEIDTQDNGGPDSWIFKSPASQVLGRAIVTSDAGGGTTTVLTCEATGASFDISEAEDCAGMEGEGGCDDGVCTP